MSVLETSPPHFVEPEAPAAEPAAALPPGRIETGFDVPLVARLALKEKQIQQNVRPVIAVHKWFARRPGTLFRALLLAEFAEGPLAEIFHRPHQLPEVRVGDPFMGGGTPLFEANRLGCSVTGWDVNPMAWWIVRQELTGLDVESYEERASRIEADLEAEIGSLYRTSCQGCGDEAAVKYFMWVKIRRCGSCARDFDLFPGYLLAASGRHPRDVLICPACGELAEVEDRRRPGECPACSEALRVDGPAGRSRCRCPHCGEENGYPGDGAAPPVHRMVAIEYHCAACHGARRGRFFKRPDPRDLERAEQAQRRLSREELSYVPEEEIPPGDETARLHRWGYRRWRDLFNARQLLGLELLARRIAAVGDGRVREALATNLSDLLRYQNMLCRYDTRALKSLDVFSVHGFPVGLVQCESNLLGIRGGPGGNVGSGGWSNIVAKFARAKRYCERPFEVLYEGGRRRNVAVPGEWIGDRRGREVRRVELHCASAGEADLAPGSLDAVLTDPPYLANVQYAELMDFCYAWLRRLAGSGVGPFAAESTHRAGDLTGNETLDRGLEQFAAGLSAVFRRFARALVPGGPFVFTYHHNDPTAYVPVVVALLDAGLVCTTTLPCPAEMGGSIHIHKSDSSILDSVFVCRTAGTVSRRLVEVNGSGELAEIVKADLTELGQAGIEATRGDARCLVFGHLARLAVWRLRGFWDADAPWARKSATVAAALADLPDWDEVQARLEKGRSLQLRRAASAVAEPPVRPWGGGGGSEWIPFQARTAPAQR